MPTTASTPSRSRSATTTAAPPAPRFRSRSTTSRRRSPSRRIKPSTKARNCRSPNIGQFTDPGFDNPLNVGGETSETFTYAINWGDGTPVDSGPADDRRAGLGRACRRPVRSTAAISMPTTASTPSRSPSATTTAALPAPRFQVTVNNVAPTLTVAPNQTINEGAPLSITEHRSVHRPGLRQPAERRRRDQREVHLRDQLGRRHAGRLGPADDRRAGLGRACPRPVRSTAAISMPTTASTRSRSRSATTTAALTSATFQVTVNNVAPTLTVAPNQTVNEGSLLSITNIGQFTDPGFDNPLNVRGPTHRDVHLLDQLGRRHGRSTRAPPRSTRRARPACSPPGRSTAATPMPTTASTPSRSRSPTTMAARPAPRFQVTVNNVAPSLDRAPEIRRSTKDAPLTITPHRPVHRPRLRQSAERRRRDDRDGSRSRSTGATVRRSIPARARSTTPGSPGRADGRIVRRASTSTPTAAFTPSRSRSATTTAARPAARSWSTSAPR